VIELAAGTSGDGHAPAPPKRVVVVVGNPNVGKTTLFNLLTRENARVGNYPGVTVERRVGRLASTGSAVELVDVPGTYSLSARSAEEQIAIQSVLGLGDEARPELVVAVVDAGQLVRNLYFVLQLAELDVPTIVALNMVDEVADNPPSPAAITALFGFPCIATSGRSGAGMDALTRAIEEGLATPPQARLNVPYPVELRRDVDRVAEALPAGWRSSVERDRALARWALLSIDETDELLNVDARLRRTVLEVRSGAGDRDPDSTLIGARYAFLDRHAPSLFESGRPEPVRHPLTERVDRVLIHPVFGFALFLGIMGLLFQSLFTWADPMIGLLEDALAWMATSPRARCPRGRSPISWCRACSAASATSSCSCRRSSSCSCSSGSSRTRATWPASRT
jgi:ferrous iron transport protein B